MKYLYLKISAALLSILVILGIVYIVLMGFVAKEYLQETNQMLYGGIASEMAKEVKPMKNGEVDKDQINKVIMANMVINPSIEIYILDTKGKIVTYVSPKTPIKIESVDLAPIKEFLTTKMPFVKGVDPRNPTERKVFSAAEIKDDGKLQGYFYIILASEEQVSVVNYLIHCYIPKIGIYLFIAALIAALGIGLLAFWFISKNLRRYIEAVSRFKEGDLKVRVCANAKGDFPVLADTFNEMADKIVANIDELKSVENLRRELIANVSHDLRTPLAIMQGYVETLLIKEEHISSEERQKYLNIILNSSEKLSGLIAQLFEYAKLEARQIEVNKEPFQIAELVQDTFAKYQVLAKEKSIKVKVEKPENLPVVFADVALVERVIQNLMDNALKFSPEGGLITISLDVLKNGVQIKVADNGPGIPEDEQAFIFDRYRKVNKLATKVPSNNNGAGLGLAIVHKILELHNSTIAVQSKINEGTAFIFSLPKYGV